MPLVVGENTYVSVVDADEYFSLRFDSSAWDNADTTLKEKALATATQRIDMQRLSGLPVSEDQYLAFPRKYLTHDNLWYEQSEVPDCIIKACCEEAIALIEQTKAIKRQEAGVISAKMGDSSEMYSENSILRKMAGKELISSIAKQLLNPYITKKAVIV